MGVKIQLFEVGAYRLDFCLCWWMKSEVYKEKVNTRDWISPSHYEQCCPHKARTPRRPQESYTYCYQEGWKAHWSRCVGFLNTYLELLQFIEIIYIINKCNKYVICLSFIPFVRFLAYYAWPETSSVKVMREKREKCTRNPYAQPGDR